MQFNVLRPIGFRKLLLNILLLTSGLGFSLQVSADYVVGSCTVRDPVIAPNGTNCPSVNLNGLSLNNAGTNYNLTYANFNNAILTNIDFTGFDFANSNFYGVDFSGSIFSAVNWDNTTCPDGTNSDQYTGNGCVGTYSDDDNDGVRNDLDAFPGNDAASKDTDSDGYPDFFNPNCTPACQSVSGLLLDMFPFEVAAFRDDDEDGFPEIWNAGCDSTCQTDSGLKIDAGQLYVDITRPWAGSDGATWTTAYPNVADALAIAGPGQEIWIADGVYYPDQAANGNTNAAAATFALIDNVNLVGGFAGGETQRSDADPVLNQVILSGDIDQNDTNVVGGVHTQFSGSNTHSGTNSHVIVTASSVTSRLVGIIISGGGTNSAGNEYGGGIKCTNSNLLLQKVKMVYNRAITSGGAIYCNNGAAHQLDLDEVQIKGNYSGNSGGGIYVGNGVLNINRSTISNNTANSIGGGITQNQSKSVISNSTIASNTASQQGGGIHITGTGVISGPRNLVMNFSTVAFNVASTSNGGGGLYITNYVDAEIKGSVFVANTAPTSGGNVYRTESDVFNASYSRFGHTADGELYLDGTGEVGTSTFLTGGANPTVSIPSPGAGGLINATLTNNGGFTPTLSIPSSSEYRNAIPFNDCQQFPYSQEDQRGFERPYYWDGNNCDLGAFELNDFDLDGSIDTFDPDIDGDGMPNTFEQSNGFNSYLVSDASQDPDGDTLTNLQEYSMSRDPFVSDLSQAETDLIISPRYHRYGFETTPATCQSLATPVTYTIKNKNASASRNFTGGISLGGSTDWEIKTGSNTCTGTLAANNSCTFQLVYCGDGVGNSFAILSVPTDDSETPNLTSALFDYESTRDEAQRKLPPVLTSVIIKNSVNTTITNGEIKGGETHTIEWTVSGYYPSYDSLFALFNCFGVAGGQCGNNYSSNVLNSGFRTPDTISAGTWTYFNDFTNEVVTANTYTYTASFTLPYNAGQGNPNQYVLRFYNNSSQDIFSKNSSLSLVIPGNIPNSVVPTYIPNSGYYDTSGRRLILKVIP